MDIVAAIDQATGCHICGGSLAESVSDLFCSEHCQRRWHERRVAPPVPPTAPAADGRPTSRRVVLNGPAAVYRSDEAGNWHQFGTINGQVEVRVEVADLAEDMAFIRERERNARETLNGWIGRGRWAL